MPATFPSHAAAVLPLKLRWPRHFDGVALVVGSAAPDLAYPVSGYLSVPETHGLWGLFWFALPVTVLVSRLIRWAAPVVAVHLPARPAALALPDYGLLAQARHRWYVTVWSALLGAATHVLWDGFTHSPYGSHGWITTHVSLLWSVELFDRPLWYLLQLLSTVAGAAIALWFAVHIGRRRLLRQWYGEAPATVIPAARRFWPTVCGVLALYPLTWPVLSYPYTPHVQGVRMLWAVGLAALAGAAVARPARVPV